MVHRNKRKCWDLHALASGITILAFFESWWQATACVAVVGAYTIYLLRKDWSEVARQEGSLD